MADAALSAATCIHVSRISHLWEDPLYYWHGPTPCKLFADLTDRRSDNPINRQLDDRTISRLGDPECIDI